MEVDGHSLDRTVGLSTATFIIIGYVVGATIFVLPGSLAAEVGPAVFVAYAIAAIPAILAGFAMAQVGAAMPISGAVYLLLDKALSPLFGFLYLWMAVSLAAVAIPLIAFGFADYLAFFVSGIDTSVAALLVTIGFIAVNTLGMRVAGAMQDLLVVAMLVALTVFGIGGLVAGDPNQLQPLFPRGFSPVVLAAITAYFSYAGVFVVAEIAGEIKQPGRNIPRAILFAFVVIILLYTIVALALAMLTPWHALENPETAVISASQIFLPEPVVTFIGLSALFAAATSINGIMMGLSRDFFQGGNSGLFPKWFSALSERTHTPTHAVVFVGLLAVAGILGGGTIIGYAQLALIGLMIIQIMTGAAVIRLPNALPEAYRQSSFRLSPGVLRFIGIALIGFSTLFLVILALEKPELMIVGALFLAVGIAGFAKWK